MMTGLFALLTFASSFIAGCSSSSPPLATPVPNSPRALSAVVAASIATSKTTAGVQMSFPKSPFVEQARGAFDFLHARGSVVLYPTSHTTRSVKYAHSWSAVFAPKIAYYQPARTSHWKLPTGKQWIAIDIAQFEEISKSLPSLIPQLEAVNPVIGLQAVRWGAVAATSVPPTSVHGNPSREYKVTIDFRSAATRFVGPYKYTFLAAIGSSITLSDRLARRRHRLTTQMLVWVDRRGRLDRLQKLTAAGQGSTLMTFGNFGQRITIARPASAHAVSVMTIAPSGERENRGGGDSDGA